MDLREEGKVTSVASENLAKNLDHSKRVPLIKRGLFNAVLRVMLIKSLEYMCFFKV